MLALAPVALTLWEHVTPQGSNQGGSIQPLQGRQDPRMFLASRFSHSWLPCEWLHDLRKHSSGGGLGSILAAANPEGPGT